MTNGERIPIGNRIKSRVGKRASRKRNVPGKRIKERLPDPPNKNIQSSTVAGAVGAAIAEALEGVAGVPLGASVDIVNVETQEDGDIYTVNVNSPTENMAEARAFIDSTTGFLSYFTDIYEVEDVEVLNHRPIRDTYQIKLKIER